MTTWLENLPANDTIRLFYQIGGCEWADLIEWQFFKSKKHFWLRQAQPKYFVAGTLQKPWLHRLTHRDLKIFDTWVEEMQRNEMEGWGSTFWEEVAILSEKDTVLNWRSVGGRTMHDSIVSTVFKSNSRILEQRRADFAKNLSQQVHGYWQPEFSKTDLQKAVLRRVSNLDSAKMRGSCIWHFDKKNVFRMLPTGDCPQEKIFKWPTKFEWGVDRKKLELSIRPDWRRMEWGEFDDIKEPFWEVESIGDSEIVLRFIWE